MTLDELIKELNEIKKKKGGNVEVFYMDSLDASWTMISDIDYAEGGVLAYAGVIIS